MRPPGPRSPIASPLPATIVGPDGRALPWEGVSAPSAGGGAVDYPATQSPLVWLEARRDEDVTTDANGITTVACRGSSGLTYSQASATLQPQRTASASFGGENVFSFDSGDVLASPSTSAISLAENGTWTVYALAQMQVSLLRVLWANDSFAGGSGGVSIDPRVGGGSRSRWDDTVTTLTHSGPAFTLNTNFLWRIEFRGETAPTVDAVEHFSNGVSSGAASTANLANAIISGAKTWCFGAVNTGGGSGFQGLVASLLVFPGLHDATQRAGMLTYFNDTFGQTFTGA